MYCTYLFMYYKYMYIMHISYISVNYISMSNSVDKISMTQYPPVIALFQIDGKFAAAQAYMQLCLQQLQSKT